jgi:hypothetical protein
VWMVVIQNQDRVKTGKRVIYRPIAAVDREE